MSITLVEHDISNFQNKLINYINDGYEIVPGTLSIIQHCQIVSLVKDRQDNYEALCKSISLTIKEVFEQNKAKVPATTSATPHKTPTGAK